MVRPMKRAATDEEIAALEAELAGEFLGRPMLLDRYSGDISDDPATVPRVLTKPLLRAFCAARGMWPQDFQLTPSRNLILIRPILTEDQ
jgi:hypothetical protein